MQRCCVLTLIPSSSSRIHHSHKSAAAVFQYDAKHDITPDVNLIFSLNGLARFHSSDASHDFYFNGRRHRDLQQTLTARMLHNSKAGTAEAKDRPAIIGGLCDSGNEEVEQLRHRFRLSLHKLVNLRERWRQPLAPHTKCLLIKEREIIRLARMPKDGRPVNC